MKLAVYAVLTVCDCGSVKVHAICLRHKTAVHISNLVDLIAAEREREDFTHKIVDRTILRVPLWFW